MKKLIVYIFLSSSLIFFLNGCVKDTCHHIYSYKYYIPVYKTTEQVKANIKSNTSKDIVNPGKIFIRGNYIFLNEMDKGIHIIDNSNPASPKNVAFIDVPGNLDLAVTGNTLYADLYTDMVTIDISNPLNVVVKKYNEGVFPFRYYSNGFLADSSKIIVDWMERDTTVTENCDSYNWPMEARTDFFIIPAAYSSNSSPKASSPVGQGGSMARFAIMNNRLYTVSDANLNTFNISTPENPMYINNKNLGTWNIETIFPFRNKLFIGSQNGMFIYNTNNPDAPEEEGQFGHLRTCDPVIADDNYAYVTLNSGSECEGFTNQLDVLSLNNLSDPQLLKSYDLTSPHGLSKDGNLLFICDGTAGLKVYDASDIMNLKLIKEIPDFETYDVIAFNKVALVVAKDGLYQYDYSNSNDIRFLSKTAILR